MNDTYEKLIYDFIVKNKLQNNVFLYGVCTDITNILAQVNIGVLSSESEGLPVALLEYGKEGLPIVATDVGECSSVIEHQKNGLLVPAKDNTSLAIALMSLIDKPNKAKQIGEKIKIHIEDQYTELSVINKVVRLYQSL